MTTTPRQRQRIEAQRLGRKTMLHALAEAEAAVEQTNENPYGALDDATIRRLRYRHVRAPGSWQGDLKRAYTEGVAEAVAQHSKPRPRPGRQASVGHLTEVVILRRMHALIASGRKAEKAATVVAAEQAEGRRRYRGGAVMTAPAIRELWLRRTTG
jgi:hypothetical protein